MRLHFGKQTPAAQAAPKPFFRASVQSDGTLELLIYEDIGEDWWDGGGLTAKTVREQLDRAGLYSRISVRINSPGGDAFEGVAIGNVLKATGKPVDVAVDGIAASAASIIAMCGSTITMAHNAMMMIHNAWTFEMGDSRAMAKMAERLDKIDGAIAQTYVDRTGKSMDDVRAMMDAETWMSADECMEQGFATAIAAEPDAEKEAEALAMARGFRTLAKMKRVPAKLKAEETVECACDCQNCMDGECENCTMQDCEDQACKDAGCPMQADENASAAAEVPAPAVEPPAAPLESNLSLYQCRQWEMEHGIPA